MSRFRSRYYPTLISLQLKDTFIRFLAFIYVIVIIAYTTYRESFCLDFMPHSENFSVRDELNLRIVRLDHCSRTRLVKESLLF